MRNDLDEDLVYNLYKAMHENQDTLAKAVVDMKELDPATAIQVESRWAVKCWTKPLRSSLLSG